MDPVATIIGVDWILAGLLVIGTSVPLARGRVGRNGLYGIRLRKSLESDDAWYAINRYGGRRLILWALPLLPIGAACLFLPLRGRPAEAIAVSLLPLIFIAIPAFQSWRFARRWHPGM